jgi:hypothetical protein
METRLPEPTISFIRRLVRDRDEKAAAYRAAASLVTDVLEMLCAQYGHDPESTQVWEFAALVGGKLPDPAATPTEAPAPAEGATEEPAHGD